MTRATVIGCVTFAIAAGLVAQDTPPQVPEVKRAVAPRYPQLPGNPPLLGRVIIEASVDAAGQVTGTKVLRAPAMLHQESERAARRWKFAPSTTTGERTVRLTFVFDLIADPVNDDELWPVFVPPYTVEVRAKCMRHCDKLEELRKEGL